MELEKAYNAANYEDRIYKAWEASGLFTPKPVKGKKPFVIAMPPPNATGTLHLGHAVMLALQDIMIRYHRMKGDPSLWIPGTDHASIATQNKVEKILAEEGKTRHSLGRAEFLKQVDAFVKSSQSTIRNQVRKMGSSCDWTRERYTLEPMLSRAVREVFVGMYNDGLIYRGNRIVNWCTRCASTLADDEVVYEEEHTKFYYLKYGPFLIGTARPEPKFGDKTIIVHPDDNRYKKLVGQTMVVPWINGDITIRVVADKNADPEFGSGAVVVTPAHDFDDFEVAKRHNVPVVQIIDEAGNLTAVAGPFAGRNAREARADIVATLEKKGLIEKIEENYLHNISLCYRCSTPIEPLVSRQWFIAVDKKFGKAKKSLKQMSLDVVRTEKIKILPERFEKTYFNWMENLHDWCISRQIWFGHQIPVWYCENSDCKDPIVATETPKKCPHCGGKNLKQDPDTLDTWFSAGLWTFSTLGWPDKTPDLKYFHPTTVLETGYDILFFWIARMIIMTSYALGEIPFKYVYLHGLVRTREGKKMSKSDPKTCIDPLDMIAKYGADALRLSMIIGNTPGNDLRLYEEKIAGFRNFVNKIWNAARFALLQVDDTGGKNNEAGKLKKEGKKGDFAEAKSLADKWILHRTQEIIAEVTKDIEAFQFSEAGTKIYDFAWNEYCSWYLEISKGDQKNMGVLMYVLEMILKLIHPFVPYVTEALWEHLGKKELLMAVEWPKLEKKFHFKKEATQMETVIEVISTIRALRHESGIAPGEKIPAVFVSDTWHELLEEKREPIMRLARLSKLEILMQKKSVGAALASVTSHGVEILLPVVGDLINLDAERTRVQREKAELEKYLKSLSGKLSNKEFVKRAPKEIVAEEQQKERQGRERLAKIEHQLEALGSKV